MKWKMESQYGKNEKRNLQGIELSYVLKEAETLIYHGLGRNEPWIENLGWARK